MELVALLRVLWSHSSTVAVGALVALAVSVALMARPAERLGVASTAVMLDTPKSQVVDVEPVGAETMLWRTPLVADLMASDELQPRLAQAMGVRPDQLVVTQPHLSAPLVNVALGRLALEAAAVTPEPYVVSLRPRSGLPILSVETSAPSRGEAGRLAVASVRILREAVANDWTRADLQAYIVERIAPVRARTIDAGPGRAAALGVGFVLFMLWCVLVVAATGIARARRASRRRRRSLGPGWAGARGR